MLKFNNRPDVVRSMVQACGALCLLMCLNLAACKSSGPDTAPSGGLGDDYPAPLNDPTISVLSPELRPWIRFQAPIIVHEPGKPYTVEVPARNVTYNVYKIEYRVLFMDKHGMQIMPEMGWKPVYMNPKEVVRLSANELGLEAESYRLEIRWSQ